MRFSKQKTAILSCEDVQKVVRYYGIDTVMDALISRMFEAFKSFDPSRTVIPARAGFSYDHPESGLIEWMPLHQRGDNVVIKVVGYHPNNPTKHELPTIISTLSAYDTSTGHLLGLMDGVLPTALRTGAASVIASVLLADPGSDTLGLIGCGAQSVTQLHALSRKFNFSKVLIYDVDQQAMASFKDRCEALEIDVHFVPSSITDIVTQSDILCTATSVEVGKGPLFKALKTKPALHINAVGADFPGKAELPRTLLENSFVSPDFREQAMLEGECELLPPEKIGPDLFEVLQNQDKYKHIQKQLSVFDSTGWALEDQVVMELFLEYAANLGLGQEIEIEFIPDDAKSPYDFLKMDSTVLKSGP